MIFGKLFQLLVVGGAMLGATSGCTSPARAEQAEKKSADAGSAKASDGKTQGTAAGGSSADAGSGSGVQGW